jgi:hypothetical protein
MAFTGKASYSNITLVGEDVSDLVQLFAPIETPFLDRLGTASRPGTNTQHQWTQQTLGPTTLINSTAIASATANTGIQLNQNGARLTVGMTLQITGTDPVTDEMVRVVSVVGASSVLVARNISGTGVDSLAAGGSLYIVGAAAEEGSETTGDISVPRTRVTNFMQIIKRPILISGTDRAVDYNPSNGDEFDWQTQLRTIEAMRDLEKSVFRGIATNSIGANDVPRMMNGLIPTITSINSTVTAASFTADPGGYLGNVWQRAWNNGARDIDLIVAGDQFKRDISGANLSILRAQMGERSRRQVIDIIETDFGQVGVMLTPWLPSSWAIGVATSRLRVVPLQGRSFQREELAKTGDSWKGHVVGEYTLETHNQNGMFQIHT